MDASALAMQAATALRASKAMCSFDIANATAPCIEQLQLAAWLIQRADTKLLDENKEYASGLGTVVINCLLLGVCLCLFIYAYGEYTYNSIAKERVLLQAFRKADD